MKTAFMISIALILPIFTAYFLVNASPPQTGKNLELSENVGVTDELKTHITHHTQDMELGHQKNCRSGIINLQRSVQCNV